MAEAEDSIGPEVSNGAANREGKLTSKGRAATASIESPDRQVIS